MAEKFFRVARNDSIMVSIIAASILPLTKLRLELFDDKEEEFKSITDTSEEGGDSLVTSEEKEATT